MSFPEEQEDKIMQFALTPKDYYYELKLAKFLYRIDKIDGPTLEDLAVWALPPFRFESDNPLFLYYTDFLILCIILRSSSKSNRF